MGGDLLTAFLVKDIVGEHDFDAAWEDYPLEDRIVGSFIARLTPEAYCVVAADKGDRFLAIEPYLALFHSAPPSLTQRKLERLLRLSELWFVWPEVYDLYRDGIVALQERLSALG